MQQAETLKIKPPMAEPVKDKVWIDRIKTEVGEKKEPEKGLKHAWMALGDMVRDVRTASEMAKEKFRTETFGKDSEGDSALKYAMRGVMTAAVGAGMEVAMDSLWNDVWQGKMPFIERFQIGSGVAEKLNKLVANDDTPYRWKTRLAYLMKEGSQDLAIATVYNMLMTFRAQQLFPKVKPEHLFASLSVDAIEALLSQTLPKDMERKAAESQNEINKRIYSELDDRIGRLKQNGSWSKPEKYEIKIEDLNKKNIWSLGTQIADEVVEDILDEVKKRNKKVFYGERTKWYQDNEELLKDLRNRKKELFKQIDWQENIDWKSRLPDHERPFHINQIEQVIRSVTNLSNPVSNLGIAMIGDSILTLKENYKKVHDERIRKGGLPGKSVSMPKQDRDRGSGYKGQDKRPWEDRKDKVYYGKSQWQQREPPVKLEDMKEEELLEKFS